MKTPTTTKKVIKKVVKKVPVKAGAASVQTTKPAVSESAPANITEDGNKGAASLVKPEEIKPETVLASKGHPTSTPKSPSAGHGSAQNANDIQESERSTAGDAKIPNESSATMAKPKTKIVKKKVVVRKGTSSSASKKAQCEADQSLSESNLPVTKDTDEKEVEKQAAGDESKEVKVSKPVKVVKKVVKKSKGASNDAKESVMLETQGKGASNDAKETAKQETQGKVASNVVKETAKQETQSKGTANDVKEIAKQGTQVVEGRSSDILTAFVKVDQAAEAPSHKANHDDEIVDEGAAEDMDGEELEFDGEGYNDEELDEEQGSDGEEGFQRELLEPRPMTEKQKRKKLEVFVGGLDKDATENDLRTVFQQVGDIVEVRLMMNPHTGKNKGYAFIRFGTAEQAARAATELARTRIRGKECGVIPNKDHDVLFIRNIARDWKSSEVLQKLQEYGVENIEELTLVEDAQNEGLNRGYAFLELATHYDALNAFKRLQQPGVSFGYDKPAKVAWAEPLNEPDDVAMSQVKSVFVDGMPAYWSDDKVKQHFGKFGEIERIVFARSMPVAKRKDFAFVNYLARESALACVEQFREVELMDGDKKVKLRVSLAKPVPKNRFHGWMGRAELFGQAGRRVGRDEAWFPNSYSGLRRGGRGFSWNSGRGTMGRGGKRFYDEDEVRMLLRLLREEEEWPVSTRGKYTRGSRFSHASRGGRRGAYTREDNARPVEAGLADPREEDPRGSDTNFARGAYHRVESEHGAPQGRDFRSGAIREDYTSQRFHGGGPPHRSRASHPGHRLVPRHEDIYHQHYAHEDGDYGNEVQHYEDPSIGVKRPASAWDDDSSYYDANHRGYPKARMEYVEAAHIPDSTSNYVASARSAPGPAIQPVGFRSDRAGLLSGREEPVPFYDGGAVVGKAGSSSLYHDHLEHGYEAMIPETSGYISAAPEMRAGALYSSSLYGGHPGSGAYDVQPRGYY